MTLRTTAADPREPDEPDEPPQLRARVRAMRVRLLFERTRTSTWTGFAALLLVVTLLWGRVPPALLGGWVAVKLALMLWRVAVRRRFADRRGWSDAQWCRRFTQVVVIDGLAWGLGVAVLAPAGGPTITMLLMATVVAVVAIAAMVLPLYLPLHVGFSLGTILPVALTQLANGGIVGLYGGVGLLLFQVFVLMEGRTAARQLIELMRLRVLLEQEAERRNEALALAQRHSAVKSQFLATMSHEMRTPLHGILGVAEQLRADAEAGVASELMRRPLELVARSGEHLLGLINDLLDFAKIEAGQMTLAEAPFELRACIDEVVALARAAARDKGLALRAELSALGAGAHWVRGDAARLRQVLHNLLGNAIKFTERGEVSLVASRDAQLGWLRIEVSDTGVGIAPEQMTRIFEAFHQGEASFDRRFAGTGLGLTIARELARAMGGDLHGRSTPGAGSSFCFEAPLPPCDAPQVLPAKSAPPVALRGRVLLVEDNAVNALVAQAMLRRCGLEVEHVLDGEQAVSQVLASRPDLVLMDCQMPTMDGITATRRIRASEAESGAQRVPIVALTANAYASDRDQCLAAGMDEHLAKPFREDELRATLARWLAPR
ncbi:ATP-binding protein [Caldimonas sp. KR1-144]|uniref:ATP-binding protein n=1 Tax=Caldimonas sp. KR1-144 TaxID=3400911 RepID=UPI003C03B2EC